MTQTARRLIPNVRELQVDWGYWLFIGHLVTIWGIALSNTLLALTGFWTWRHKNRFRGRWSEISLLMVPLGLYSVFTMTSIFFSMDPQQSFSASRELLNLSTLVFTCFWLTNPQRIRRALELFVLMALGVATMGIGQFFWTRAGGLHQRITGGFSHYQTYSGVLLLAILIAAALVTRRSAISWWLTLGLCWLGLALALTLTRGAWVSLLLTLVGAAALGARKAGIVRPGLALGALSALALVVLPLRGDGGGLWAERLKSIVDLQDTSNYDRICMLEAGLYMIEERPLFGIGPNMVRDRYGIYRHPTAPRVWVPHLHNSWLQIAAERGLLTLAACWALFAVSLSTAWKRHFCMVPHFENHADLHLAALLSLTGFGLAALFENNWGDTEVQRVVLFLLAVPICLANYRPPSELRSKLEDPPS